MSADVYLQNILTREAVDTGLLSPVRYVQRTIQLPISEGRQYAFAVNLSAHSRREPRTRPGKFDIDLLF